MLPPGTPPFDWNDFSKLFTLLSQLSQSQPSKLVNPSSSTNGSGENEPLDNLYNWLQKNGAKVSSKITFRQLKPGLNGVVAVQDIDKKEQMLSIPVSLMITSDLKPSSSSKTESTRSLPSKLESQLAQDPIMQSLPNLILAVKLVYHATNLQKSSFYWDYIQILPDSSSLTIPLMWDDINAIQSLKGTSVFPEVLSLFKSVARQYIHLRTQYGTWFKDLSFNDFKWAVACIMTRQNNINERTLALIPGYDMLNHEAGCLTKGYVCAKTNASVLECGRATKSGKEVVMEYGERSNQHFFVYSGFIDSSFTQYDGIKILLPVPPTVLKQLPPRIIRILQQVLRCRNPDYYLLTAPPYTDVDFARNRIFAFLRIVNGTWNNGSINDVNDEQEVMELFSAPGKSRSRAVETNMIKYLLGRCKLVLLGMSGSSNDSKSQDTMSDYRLSMAQTLKSLERDLVEAVRVHLEGVDMKP